MKIRMKIGNLAVDGELNDTPTARRIANALPMDAPFSLWGDEIYFSTDVASRLDEGAKEFVEAGDLGYWPTAKAFCIFYGPTPISEAGEIRPASAVNIIGKVTGDPTQFKSVTREGRITVEKA